MRQSPSLTTASVCKPCAAGLCRLPSAPAGMSTFPTLSPQSLSSRLDPYPAVFLRCLPVSSRRTAASPWGRAAWHTERSLQSNFHRAILSGLQSFNHVQAPQLARPPGCTHRKTSECLGRPGRIHQAELGVVTDPKHWHRYVPESGNWHGGTCTRWIAALSAAPVSLENVPPDLIGQNPSRRG
jgi:hypothetical protein